MVPFIVITMHAANLHLNLCQRVAKAFLPGPMFADQHPRNDVCDYIETLYLSSTRNVKVFSVLLVWYESLLVALPQLSMNDIARTVSIVVQAIIWGHSARTAANCNADQAVRRVARSDYVWRVPKSNCSLKALKGNCEACESDVYATADREPPSSTLVPRTAHHHLLRLRNACSSVRTKCGQRGDLCAFAHSMLTPLQRACMSQQSLIVAILRTSLSRPKLR